MLQLKLRLPAVVLHPVFLLLLLPPLSFHTSLGQPHDQYAPQCLSLRLLALDAVELVLRSIPLNIIPVLSPALFPPPHGTPVALQSTSRPFRTGDHTILTYMLELFPSLETLVADGVLLDFVASSMLYDAIKGFCASPTYIAGTSF